MAISRTAGILVCVFVALVFGALTASGTDLVYIYEDGCPHCARIDTFLTRIQPEYPILQILRYEIHDSETQELLDRLLIAFGVELGSVPMLFIGDVAAVGGTYYGLYEQPYATSGRAEESALQRAIERAIEESASSPLARVEGLSGGGIAKSLTLPAVVLAALADSVNPCCFAILVLLFGTLIVAGRKGKVLPIGLAFTAGIYITYFLMGIGILSAIQAAGVQRIFMLAVSSLAILLGLWNMKDYFAYGKWFTIEVPKKWRPIVKRITSSVVSIPGAFAVGVFDSIFLLPCSSGPYIAILALLTKTTSRSQGILYLLLYNFIVIIPLLAFTLAIHFGYTTTARAERWRSARLGTLHLVSGVVMVLLGVGMIVAVQLGYM